MLDQVPAVTFVALDRDGCVRETDAGLELPTGVPLAELAHPEDRAAATAWWLAAAGGALVVARAELRIGPAARWHALELRTLVDAGGEPAGALVGLLPITGRRELEGRGNGALLADGRLEDPTAIVAVRDLDGVYLRVNGTFERHFTIAAATLQGRSDDYLFPQRIAETLRYNDGEARHADVLVEHAEMLPQVDGPHPFACVRFPLRGAGGAPFAVCMVGVEGDDPGTANAVAARLLTTERQARADAAKVRGAHLDAEAAAWMDAREARAAWLERLADEGRQPAHDTTAAHADEAPAQTEALDALNAERDELEHALDAERASHARTRADADTYIREQRRTAAEREAALQAAVDQAGARAAAEREARAEAERELRLLRGHGLPFVNGAKERDGSGAGPAPEPVAAGGDLAAAIGSAEVRTARVLAGATSPEEAARELLRVLCEELDFDAGACWRREGAALRCCAFWTVATLEPGMLESATWQAAVKPGDGLVGQSFERAAATTSDEVAAATNGFASREAAATAAGLVAGAALPVLDGDGEVMAVIELLRKDSAPAIEAITPATSVAAQLGPKLAEARAELLAARW